MKFKTVLNADDLYGGNAGIICTISSMFSHLIPLLLPPPNKVCEGYVFTGVCLSTGGGMHGWGGEACMAGGASMAGGHAWQGACVAGEMANVADGTHPTGMHYCCKIFANKEDKWQG